MDSWSYGRSVFLPNETIAENQRSMSGFEFEHGLSTELETSNGFITKVSSSSSSCLVPSSYVEENQFLRKEVEQRFCQQCSRFHFLSEFDDGKRSCRRCLAGHNEHRRKPSLYFLPAVMETEGFDYLKESCMGLLSELLEYVARLSEHSLTSMGQMKELYADGGDVSGRRVKQRLH